MNKTAYNPNDIAKDDTSRISYRNKRVERCIELVKDSFAHSRTSLLYSIATDIRNTPNEMVSLWSLTIH